MTPSNRGTMESDVDPSGELTRNGDDVGGSSNGHDDTDNGQGSRRRSTIVANAVPMPERGSTSARGASSSSILRRPSVDDGAIDEVTHGDGADAATAVVAAQAVDGTVVEEPQTNGSWPGPLPTPVGLDPPVLREPSVFDDEATSEPYGMPTIEIPEDGVLTEIEPLPLPAVTPTGLEPTQPGPVDLSQPTWMPVIPPDVPLESPYVTTSITTHKVAPVPRIVGRRPRVRKVTRVVRHVDPWSVFKIALIFNLVVYGVLLTAGVLLWNVAYATGTIDNLERFFESFGWSEFEFNGGAIYHSAWIAGLFGVIGLTGAAVLGATLFNLITDLVGGVRFTVLEEEVVERTASPMRRFVVRRPGSTTPEEEPLPHEQPAATTDPDGA